MHGKTRSVEALSQLYRYIHAVITLLIILIGIFLPDFISEKINTNLTFIRILTFVCLGLVDHVIVKKLHHLWLLSYNQTVEKDVYTLQQALTDTVHIAGEDIDKAISLLNQIKNAKSPNDDNKA